MTLTSMIPLPPGEGLRPRQAQRPVGRKGEAPVFPGGVAPHPPRRPSGYARRCAGSPFSRWEKETQT
jgi:hypothetical protein